MKKISSTHYAILLLALLTGIMAFKAANTCNLSGVVVDKGTKDPVLAASVILTQAGKRVAATQTDFDGNFCLNGLADGSYDIEVKYVGTNTYTKKNIVVKDGKSAPLKIELEQTQVQMDMLIVSNYKYEKKAGTRKNLSFNSVGTANGTVSYDWTVAPPAPTYDLKEESENRAKDDDKSTNTNDFGSVVENEFLQPANKPLSTFSIDVDVASYGMMRKQLEANQMPAKESIRLEEMINYFTYNYANPGADKPFSVAAEVGECPWNSNHRLLHVGIQGRRMEKDALPPSNLVFLIDVSGSMQQADKLPLVQQSLRLLVNELSAQDKIAMVVYAGNSGLVLPSTSCSQKEKILRAIDNLQAGGSTNGAAGINQAYEVAKANFLSSGNNRVILCTDGDFNVGINSDADLVALIEKKREEGVFLSVLGFGMGNYKDSKMEKLADKGNGNYAYIDNLAEAKKNLVTQMGGTLLTIAKDVKIQVEFNPAKVKAYRLIGYENRALADKDFNDDKKDAGEIGAGVSVTALYEIITDANDPSLKEIPKTDALKYQKTEASAMAGSNEMLNVKIRYKEPKEDNSKLIEFPVADGSKKINETSENFRFAAAVASFGMLLRDSKYKGNFTYDKVRELAITAKGADTEGYRAEFLKLVNKAKTLGGRAAIELQED
jgi:Ca-activated chloride channel family protein